jgi:hypothetical protein
MSRKSAAQRRRLDLLIGARALAGYIFGDEEQWRKVYPLKSDLGLFRLRGQICGRPATIDSRIRAREDRASVDAA